MTTINEKLADISLVMGDGYMFLEVRSFLEGMEIAADAGDSKAAEMLKHIDTMYRLCKYFHDQNPKPKF